MGLPHAHSARTCAADASAAPLFANRLIERPLMSRAIHLPHSVQVVRLRAVFSIARTFLPEDCRKGCSLAASRSMRSTGRAGC
jgi:hypothetical protein